LAQTNLTKAREQLGYALLKADFDGVVTAIGAEIGQVVTPGQAVVTIARPDIREAVIDIADDLAATLRIGLPFVVTLQLDTSIHIEGKVREIAPQADAAARDASALLSTILQKPFGSARQLRPLSPADLFGACCCHLRPFLRKTVRPRYGLLILRRAR
jgi:multidrug efflux pump subunit AcrA (membrane-fusion protein)